MATSPTAPPALLLADGIAEVVVRPGLGGAVAAYDLVADHLVADGRVALFRRAAPGAADVMAMACAPLLPWSNRISGGGFHHQGRWVALAPNWPGEPLPLHGNGFLAPWRVVGQRRDAVELTLDSSGPGAFRYTARLHYWLAGGGLGMRLAVVHTGTDALPYGLGFHPWLVRDRATVLQAPARAVWLEDARHLPTVRVPVATCPAWDFTRPRRLPAGWINNGFVGWNGRATVSWPERRLALAIDAGAGADMAAALSTYILYSPDAAAGFFCFEPVSHPVDAHNLPGTPEGNGLFMLGPGQSAAVQCRFTPSAL